MDNGPLDNVLFKPHENQSSRIYVFIYHQYFYMTTGYQLKLARRWYAMAWYVCDQMTTKTRLPNLRICQCLHRRNVAMGVGGWTWTDVEDRADVFLLQKLLQIRKHQRPVLEYHLLALFTIINNHIILSDKSITKLCLICTSLCRVFFS